MPRTLSTRFDASRDLVTIADAPIDYLDFASLRAGRGGELGLDAMLGRASGPATIDRIASRRVRGRAVGPAVHALLVSRSHFSACRNVWFCEMFGRTLTGRAAATAT
jgi:3-polyprenyl-4-hydroxybenzoate decarboxylase